MLISERSPRFLNHLGLRPFSCSLPHIAAFSCMRTSYHSQKDLMHDLRRKSLEARDNIKANSTTSEPRDAGTANDTRAVTTSTSNFTQGFQNLNPSKEKFEVGPQWRNTDQM